MRVWYSQRFLSILTKSTRAPFLEDDAARSPAWLGGFVRLIKRPLHSTPDGEPCRIAASIGNRTTWTTRSRNAHCVSDRTDNVTATNRTAKSNAKGARLCNSSPANCDAIL